MELNPKAVVPTLAIGDEIVTDTIRIVYRIDRGFEGRSLTLADPEAAEAMDRMMREVMGLHYGVLMYSRRLDARGKSSIVVARGNFLREQRAKYPERAGGYGRGGVGVVLFILVVLVLVGGFDLAGGMSNAAA